MAHEHTYAFFGEWLRKLVREIDRFLIEKGLQTLVLEHIYSFFEEGVRKLVQGSRQIEVIKNRHKNVEIDFNFIKSVQIMKHQIMTLIKMFDSTKCQKEKRCRQIRKI